MKVNSVIMPASLGIMGGEIDHPFGPTPSALEEQKAIQLALELSMLGLHHNNDQPLSHDSVSSTESAYFSSNDDLRILPKKSQNMTECVPVPSSEHVAEIVGRQGCKIKALRAKTNTYIKTPVRGEEPVFVVTGRKEDVALAKREILSAAEHFSQIRASRKGGVAGTGGGLSCAPAPVPGQVTIQVRVPYRVVGLVVGPKGATIKRIQQQTHTYIVTPSRDKDPVFEVTGLPDNVQMAKREIEAHIAIRTGSLPMDGVTGDDLTNGQSELIANLYKHGIGLGLDSFGVLPFSLEDLVLPELGQLSSLGGTINSLSSSLSSVSGLGLGGAFESADSGNSGSVGSSTSGGGSLSSLSDLNGFSSSAASAGVTNNVATVCSMGGSLSMATTCTTTSTHNSSSGCHNNVVVYGHHHHNSNNNMTENTFSLFSDSK